MSSSTENRPSEASEVALSCPICMEIYTSIRYPIVSPECGHSICVDCGKERNSNICVICKSESYSFHATMRNDCGLTQYKKRELKSRRWKKNFALLDLIEEYSRSEQEKQRLTEQLSVIEEKNFATNIDIMECSNCKSKEKRKRMKICLTCGEKWNEKWIGMQNKNIPFIICGCCCVEEHPGHRIIKYLPLKLKLLVATTVFDGKSTVHSMDEVCAHEIEKGKEQLGKWNEKMDSFNSIDCKTYRDGLSIVDSLKKESDLVCRASEDTLPTLRMYTKVVKDSISRLDLLKKGESSKNE